MKSFLETPDKALRSKLKLCQLQFYLSALQSCSTQPTINIFRDIQHGNTAPSGPAAQSDTICFKSHYVIQEGPNPNRGHSPYYPVTLF